MQVRRTIQRGDFLYDVGNHDGWLKCNLGSGGWHVQDSFASVTHRQTV
jgi:hypothetical protein